jgi:hypothetical protein
VAPKVGEQHYGTSTKFRARRLIHFIALVDEVLKIKKYCRVIDLGGNRDYWIDLEPVWKDRPLQITTVNLEAERIDDSRFESIQGNCCNMSQFQDNAFDIVHSNSVLEHVGRWENMKAMAGEIQRLAPRYFVQTPNYWFPIEPHFKFVGFHWLPEPVRIDMVLRMGLGAYPKASDIDQAQDFIEDSILLDARRFRSLFLDARLKRERFLGLTKSLIAMR